MALNIVSSTPAQSGFREGMEGTEPQGICLGGGKSCSLTSKLSYSMNRGKQCGNWFRLVGSATYAARSEASLQMQQCIRSDELGVDYAWSNFLVFFIGHPDFVNEGGKDGSTTNPCANRSLWGSNHLNTRGGRCKCRNSLMNSVGKTRERCCLQRGARYGT